MISVVFIAPAAAASAFKRLARVLGDGIEPSFHSMLLSTAALPDPGWSLRAEAEALRSAVEPLERFHIVAFSGGATVALRYLDTRDRWDRIQSLTLMEPPWVGLDFWSDSERQFVEAFDRLITLEPHAMLAEFAALYSPGVPLPAPPDIERAALELQTCWRGYRAEALDRDALSALDVPVYLPVASDSPRRMRDTAELLARVFPRGRVEVFQGRSHFDLFYASADAIAAGVRRCFS